MCREQGGTVFVPCPCGSGTAPVRFEYRARIVLRMCFDVSVSCRRQTEANLPFGIRKHPNISLTGVAYVTEGTRTRRIVRGYNKSILFVLRNTVLCFFVVIFAFTGCERGLCPVRASDTLSPPHEAPHPGICRNGGNRRGTGLYTKTESSCLPKKLTYSAEPC